MVLCLQNSFVYSDLSMVKEYYIIVGHLFSHDVLLLYYILAQIIMLRIQKGSVFQSLF